MKSHLPPPPSPPSRGFTIIELLLVVAVSAFLFLGMAALVEVPRQAAEEEAAGADTAASSQTLIARLDQDVRYAVDVRVPNEREVQIDLRGGGTVTYSWAGSSTDPVIRDDGTTRVAMLQRVGRVAFTLDEARQRVRSTGEGSVVETEVRTAAFSAFSILPAYLLAGVLELTSPFKITNQRNAGLMFTARGLATDDAAPSALTVRLRRNGSGDLRVAIYEADIARLEKTGAEDEIVASAKVRNAELPTTFEDFVIPLVSERKVRNGAQYIAVLTSSDASGAADIESRWLSIAAAAGAAPGGFVTSLDGGATFAPLTSLLKASQSVFELSVTQESAVAPSDSGVAFVAVRTGVRMKLVLLTDGGTETMNVSFPLLNNVELVR